MNKKDLEKRIIALENLIEQKDELIKQLFSELANKNQIPYDDRFKPPFIVECQHDYPLVWHGTVPPHCSCGKRGNMIDIQYTTGNPPWDFNDFGGNVMGLSSIIF